MLGIFTGQLVVNVLFATASVTVNASVVPSYARCTDMVSPLSRLTPDEVMSTAGIVGEAPFVYIPVESVPSPALLKKSNFTATLLAIGVPEHASGLVGASGP